MLLLSRKKSEKIIIGDCIEITVVEIRGSNVRIGVTAPKNISVDRQEVAVRKTIVHRLSAGESLGDIEMEMDWEDNRAAINQRAATKAAS